MVDINDLFNSVVNRRTEELLQSPEIALVRNIGVQGNIQAAARDRQLQAISDADTTSAQISNINSGIIKYNLNLTLDKMRRDAYKTASTQRAQAASTGFNVNSGSYLMLYNEAAEIADREAISARVNADFQLKKISLEGEAQKRAFAIQAADVKSQKESDRLKVVAEQYSALTQFLSGQIFRSDYTLAGASNAVRDKVVKSILG